MERKLQIILAILFILIIGAGIIIFYRQTSLSPTASELEECKTLIDNGKDKINLVFFSDKQTSEKYLEFFLSLSPFKENKNNFNFYYINSYSPSCEIYKGIALLCYSKELVRKASSCPNDYIMVIKDETASIRSSAYMNLISLNSNSPLNVLSHEFGHVFANLADEYVPATLPKKAKNCVSNCSQFKFEIDGCYEGCSKEDYFRGIELGIMRTLSSINYGKLNEKLILEKINENHEEITGAVAEEKLNCKNQEYYLIDGEYSSGKISVKEKNIEPGCIGKNGAGDFEYKLILKDNSILSTGEFNPELIFTDIQETGKEQITGSVEEREGEFILKIPVIENSDSLEISKQGEKITQIDLKDIGAIPCRK
mgnify:CR=1 FL=1